MYPSNTNPRPPLMHTHTHTHTHTIHTVSPTIARNS